MPQNNHHFEDHYAIVVGIKKYPGLGSLNYPLSDAYKFYEWLTSSEGGNLKEDNIVRFDAPETWNGKTSDTPPTILDIFETFHRLGLRNKYFRGQRLYFFYSGHGVGLSDRDLGLLMANAQLDVDNLCLGIDKTDHRFKSKPVFKEIIYILDCCRNHNLQDRTVLLPPNFHTEFQNLWDPQECVTSFIYATTDRNPAFETAVIDSDDQGNGILTTAVLEHLTGEGGVHINGNITTKSLENYLSTRVADLAAQKNYTQRADVKTYPTQYDEIIFGKSPLVRQEREFRIYPSNHFEGSLIVRDSNNIVVDRTEAGGLTEASPWIIPLEENAFYSLASDPARYHRMIITETDPDVIVLEAG